MRKLSFTMALAIAGSLLAQPQPPGQAMFQSKCASCHSAQGGAPDLAALNAMPTESIFDALMKGKMKEQAASMTSRERRTVAEFLGKRPLNDPAAGDVAKMTTRCASNPDLGDINATPAWSGWGGSTNARFQTSRLAGLAAADVPRLKLKWAFGLPGGSSLLFSARSRLRPRVRRQR